MSMVHLIPIVTTIKASELAWLYLKNLWIAKINHVWSWSEIYFHWLIRNKLLISTAFHPQTNGISECAIQTITQILHSTVQPEHTDCIEKVSLVKFAINSSINASTEVAPFELNYGYMPCIIRELVREPMPGVKAFAKCALDNLAAAHNAIIESQVSQTHYANQHQHAENIEGLAESSQKEKLVYLSTQNLALPKESTKKLMSWFTGLFKILKAHSETSSYTLDLSKELWKRRIHPTFHVLLLRHHEPNDDILFSGREPKALYDFGQNSEEEYFVDEIVAHQWRGNFIEFLVHFDDGDILWESYSNCKDLKALDHYLELQDMSKWHRLSHKQHAQNKLWEQTSELLCWYYTVKPLWFDKGVNYGYSHSHVWKSHSSLH